MFWSVSGTIVSKGAVFLAAACVARILGKEKFGEVGIIQNTVQMGGAVVGFAIAATATKHIAEYRKTRPVRAANILTLALAVSAIGGTIGTLALLFLAPAIATSVLGAAHLAFPLQLSAGLFFFSALNGGQSGALAGMEAFKEMAIVNVLVGMSSLPLIVLGAVWGSVQGVVLAYVAASALNVVLYTMVLRRSLHAAQWTLNLRNCRSEFPMLFRFTLPSLFSGVLSAATQWVCSVMLVNQADGFAKMGLLNAANQWRQIFVYLPSVIASVALPLLSSLAGEKSRSANDEGMELVNASNQIVVWPMAMMLMLSATPVMALYGDKFSDGGTTLVWIIGGYAVGFVGQTIGTILISKGMMWFCFFQNVSLAAVNVGLVYLLIERNGPRAIGMASGIAFLVLIVWAVAVLIRKNVISAAMGIRTLLAAGTMFCTTAIVSIHISQITVMNGVAAFLILLPMAFVFMEKRIVRKISSRVVAILRHRPS